VSNTDLDIGTALSAVEWQRRFRLRIDDRGREAHGRHDSTGVRARARIDAHVTGLCGGDGTGGTWRCGLVADREVRVGAEIEHVHVIH
jgi:hypothetical protein